MTDGGGCDDREDERGEIEGAIIKIRSLSISVVPAIIGLVFVLCGGLYHILLSNYFLNDDFGRIIWLTPLQDMGTLDALISLFANSYHPVYYRPFTNLVFYLLRQVVGLNAEYYYLSSIILHFVSCVAFFYLVRELADRQRVKGRFFPIVATLLFTVNPRHVEAVSYIHDNENVICGLFFFLGLFLFIRYCKSQREAYLAFSAISYMFSLFGKEMGVTLPLVCFAYYAFVFATDFSIKEIYRDRVVRKSIGAFTSVMILYMVLRYNGLGMLIGGGGFTGDLDFSLLRMLRTGLQSMIAMGLPNDVPGLHAAAVFFRGHIVLFCGLGLLSGGFVVYKARDYRDRVFWFGAIWAVLTLVPVLNNGIGVAELTGGRYLYVPLAGFAICLASLLSQFKTINKTLVCAGLIILVYSSFTYRNNLLMYSVSQISEGFLRGLEEVLDIEGQERVVIVLPSMYKGMYMLQSSLDSALNILYGERGVELNKRIAFILYMYVENHADFDVRVEHIGDMTRVDMVSGAQFFRKKVYYGQSLLDRFGLSFQDNTQVNTNGDYISKRAEFSSVDVIVIPELKDPASGNRIYRMRDEM